MRYYILKKSIKIITKQLVLKNNLKLDLEVNRVDRFLENLENLINFIIFLKKFIDLNNNIFIFLKLINNNIFILINK